MDYVEIDGIELEGQPLVSNAKLYNFSNAVRGSKFPMATDVNKVNGDVVKRTYALGQANEGSGHDCFLKGCIVVFDLTFSVKANVELERYHFIDFVSSQSTMHCIKKFDLDKQYISYVDKRIVDIMHELQDNYNENPTEENYLTLLYSNPCGFRLTAEMTTNYLQLKTIYRQRKNHRLPEWKAFCKWCETLPMFKEIVLGDDNEWEKELIALQ